MIIEVGFVEVRFEARFVVGFGVDLFSSRGLLKISTPINFSVRTSEPWAGLLGSEANSNP